MKMIDDFEYLEDLSKSFQEQVVNNQRKLNEVRRRQFESVSTYSSKVSNEKPRNMHRFRSESKSEDFLKREKDQISVLVQELNKRLLSKIKIVEDDSFKMHELLQERMLLKELEKKREKRVNDALEILSEEYDAPLNPLLAHVDILLQKQELTEKQKNHLKNIKENVLSCLNAV
jgi:hypothetical protein